MLGKSFKFVKFKLSIAANKSLKGSTVNILILMKIPNSSTVSVQAFVQLNTFRCQ